MNKKKYNATFSFVGKEDEFNSKKEALEFARENYDPDIELELIKETKLGTYITTYPDPEINEV